MSIFNLAKRDEWVEDILSDKAQIKPSSRSVVRYLHSMTGHNSERSENCYLLNDSDYLVKSIRSMSKDLNITDGNVSIALDDLVNRNYVIRAIIPHSFKKKKGIKFHNMHRLNYGAPLWKV